MMRRMPSQQNYECFETNNAHNSPDHKRYVPSLNDLPTETRSQCKSYIVILKFNRINCSEFSSTSTDEVIFVNANAYVSQKNKTNMVITERRDMITPIFVACEMHLIYFLNEQGVQRQEKIDR